MGADTGWLQDAATFDGERLRAALSPVPQHTTFIAEEGVGDTELTPAAVLFPIVLREDRPTVLLTQRTAHLKDHAGQISFPGGRVEPDDRSPEHTALRETLEEIGLHADRIEVVGYLPEYRTGTGYRVTPVVGFVRPPFELRPDDYEVADIFEVPLAFLLDETNHQPYSRHYRGRMRNFVAMPYGDRFIWGATAGIIVSLVRALDAGR